MDAPVSLTIDPINILGEVGNLKDAGWFFEMRMEGDTKEKMGHVLEGASLSAHQRPCSTLVPRSGSEHQLTGTLHVSHDMHCNLRLTVITLAFAIAVVIK